jgi:hypothetical protein
MLEGFTDVSVATDPYAIVVVLSTPIPVVGTEELCKAKQLNTASM